jgi:hypothetical protein
MKEQTITFYRVNELFIYDKETGNLIRKIASGYRGRNVKGSVAGHLHAKTGYNYVSIDNIRLLSHRVIWLLVHGVWPVNQIDHLNGNRADNRIENLRDVPRSTNQQNRHRSNKNASCALLGVSKHRYGYVAKCGNKYIGLFKTELDAHEAYIKEKRQMHNGCTL